MTEDGDVALIARQLADLTETVEAMAKQLQAVLERAATDRARADIRTTASPVQRVN
jgi:hypothetical protein